MPAPDPALCAPSPHASSLGAPSPTSLGALVVAGVAVLATVALAAVAGTTPAARADTLVVAHKAADTVTLFDLPDGRAVATLPTGEGPHEVAISPDGRTALVTDYGRQSPGRTLTVIDIPGATVEKTIDLGSYRRPHGVAWLDDRHALVTAEAQRALLVVDVEAGTVVRALDTDQQVSHMVALAPDRRRAYVTNIGSGTLTVLDLDTSSEADGDDSAPGRVQVATGAGAEGVAVTPDGRIWVTNREDDTVSVVDPESLEVVATHRSEGFPIRAAAAPSGDAVLVSNARAGTVTVLDPTGEAPPRALSMEPGGGDEADGGNEGSGETLAAGATAGRLFGDRFGDSSVPIGVLVTPDGERAWVAHANADRVSEHDLASGRLLRTLATGAEPDGMGWSSRDVETAPSEDENDAPSESPAEGPAGSTR